MKKVILSAMLMLFCGGVQAEITSAMLDASQVESCRYDKGAIYPDCDKKTGQLDILKAAIEKAKTEKKNIMLVFGYDDCSYCIVFNNALLKDVEFSEKVKDQVLIVKLNVEKGSHPLLVVNYLKELHSSVWFDAVPFAIFIRVNPEKLSVVEIVKKGKKEIGILPSLYIDDDGKMSNFYKIFQYISFL